MAPRVLRAAVTLCLAAQAEGQFLRSVMVKQGPSESMMSSSSWFRGEDGEVHHKTKEEHTKITSDEYGMQRDNMRTSCIDGNCNQRQTITMSVPADHPCPMHAMMVRMARAVGFGGPPPPASPMSGPFGERPPMPPQMMMMPPPMMGPPPMVAMEPPMPPPPGAPRLIVVSGPSLRGMLQRLRFGAAGVDSGRDMAMVRAPAHYSGSTMPLDGPIIAASAAAAFLVTMLTLAFLKFRLSPSAREPRLSNLAEPLAPEESAFALPPKAPAPAKQPEPLASATAAARSFLPDIYAKAQAAIESKAVRGYLAAVYERAAAAA